LKIGWVFVSSLMSGKRCRPQAQHDDAALVELLVAHRIASHAKQLGVDRDAAIAAATKKQIAAHKAHALANMTAEQYQPAVRISQHFIANERADSFSVAICDQ
jgi:methylphosphotriester-DNA--protein-cysteine methyltransferase